MGHHFDTSGVYISPILGRTSHIYPPYLDMGSSAFRHFVFLGFPSLDMNAIFHGNDSSNGPPVLTTIVFSWLFGVWEGLDWDGF